MDVCILLFMVMPALLLWGARLARRGNLRQHRKVQAASLATMLILIALLESDIRLSGGTAAFLRSSSMNPIFVRGFLWFHIAIALATAGLWIGLLVRSWRRFRATLPGPFSATHRRLGKVTISGVGLLSSTGALLYIFLFVL